MNTVQFNAMDPEFEAILKLEGKPVVLMIRDAEGRGLRLNAYLHKHKRGPFWYVFEKQTGLGLNMRGQRTQKEALENGRCECASRGVTETRLAICRAIKRHGVLNGPGLRGRLTRQAGE
jgi:hypothetical protein